MGMVVTKALDGDMSATDRRQPRSALAAFFCSVDRLHHGRGGGEGTAGRESFRRAGVGVGLVHVRGRDWLRRGLAGALARVIDRPATPTRRITTRLARGLAMVPSYWPAEVYSIAPGRLP